MIQIKRIISVQSVSSVLSVFYFLSVLGSTARRRVARVRKPMAQQYGPKTFSTYIDAQHWLFSHYNLKPMPRILPLGEAEQSADTKAAFAAHVTNHNSRITNMKSTMGRSVLVFNIYMQWYDLYEQVKTIVGSRALTCLHMP